MLSGMCAPHPQTISPLPGPAEGTNRCELSEVTAVGYLVRPREGRISTMKIKNM